MRAGRFEIRLGHGADASQSEEEWVLVRVEGGTPDTWGARWYLDDHRTVLPGKANDLGDVSLDRARFRESYHLEFAVRDAPGHVPVRRGVGASLPRLHGRGCVLRAPLRGDVVLDPGGDALERGRPDADDRAAYAGILLDDSRGRLDRSRYRRHLARIDFGRLGERRASFLEGFRGPT